MRAAPKSPRPRTAALHVTAGRLSVSGFFQAALLLALFLLTPSASQATGVPSFASGFTNEGSVLSSSNQITYAPNLTFSNGVETNGPPDATNATTLFFAFLSNSLGDVSDPTSVGFHMPTNAATVTNMSNIPGIQAPDATNTNVWHPNGGYLSNNAVWMGINLVPGTNTTFVTNYIRVLALDGNNNQSSNWVTTNLALAVSPPLPSPPHLEIRFYNTSTNAASNVFILPTSTTPIGNFGNAFWWTNGSNSNTYTNWITNGVATLRLSDIGVTGTNAQGRPYYSVYTTNFPNSAWYLSYGGGALTNGAPAPAANTAGSWYGHEWAPFEVTLDGNAADKCDMTYINQFSIPVTVRALTNSYEDSTSNIFPTNSVANLYQICGFTNWTDVNAVAASLSNMATQLSNKFPNARITNGSGTAVMYAGPSAAPAGALVAPQVPPFTDLTPNSFPTFGTYFTAVRTNTARTNKIKDSIGLSGRPDTELSWGNTGSNPVFMFQYDFDLVVTASNSLLLTNGTITVSNQPGSTATNLTPTNYTGLWMEIGADAGVDDNWASSAVYLAPTPANYITNTGTNAAVQLYSTNASNSLGGQQVFNSSTNIWAQVASNTATVTNANGSFLPDPTVEELYQSQFGTAVMGRILGDMAAGFALGFIDSDTINPAYTTNSTNAAYGDSPSGSWWGGNEFPQANTVNSNAYSSVNTNYSEWGNTIYIHATRVTYAHPIYDRMQFYGGGNPTDPLQIQPASATNNVGPTGHSLPVWVVEVEFFNGLSSVGSTPPEPPGAPTITGIASGNTYLSVAFTPPASPGSSAITNYEYSTNSGVSWIPFVPASTNSPLFITNLVNGTSYPVEIRAANSEGPGAASGLTNGTPAAWTNSFFTIRSPGGVTLMSATNTAPAVGVSLAPSTSAWSVLSDEEAKAGFAEVDHRETLRKVDSLPIESWRYNHDPVRRYIGPMAQDFHSAFGLGRDGRHISTLDLDGVSLSALKGLLEELRAAKDRNAKQEQRLAELEAEFERLQQQGSSAHLDR